jgi:poly-gamma-glutamate synthesis protein (capsule biosynthesis protein)
MLDGGGEEVLWQTPVGGPVTHLATLPEVAVASTLGSGIAAYDERGRPLWEIEAEAPVGSLGTLLLGAEGRIVLGLRDSRLVVLGPEGQTLWGRTLSDPPGGAPVWQAAELVEGEKPVIIAGTGGDAPILALLSHEGEVLWRIRVPSAVGAVSAADLDGDGMVEILAGLADSQVLVLDREGCERGSVRAGLGITGLEADGDAVLVRADVVAWRLVGAPGEDGGTWLPPPAMVPTSGGGMAAALEGEGRPAREGEATLIFLGDVGLGRTMEAKLARYGPDYPWTGWGPLVSDAGLAVANLEGVLTTQGRPMDKSYLIRGHPYWAQSLEAAGFDLVTLANNHALDFGQEGLVETLDRMESMGIVAVGAGRTAQDARLPALFNLEGLRVAVLGYAARRWNGSVDVPETERIAWADPRLVREDVQAVGDESDLVVVLLHAGTEYASEPSADQVAVAHAAIDAGAGLVVGHHPHVTQTVERYADGLIVYSLGDAVFDIPRRDAMRGHLLRVIAGRDGLLGAELWPFWIEDAIRPRLLQDDQGKAKVKIVYP